MSKKSILFIILIILMSAVFLSTYFKNDEVGVITNFEGILTAPCGGVGDGYFCSAPPSINYKGEKCTMNLLLKTINSNGSWWYDYGNVRTSFCFFESKFNQKDFKDKFIDKNVVIQGSVKNATICALVQKCSEPECSKCSEQEILVPVNIQ